MLNPKDFEMMDDSEQMKLLDPEFLSEFENGKGGDEEDGTVEGNES